MLPRARASICAPIAAGGYGLFCALSSVRGPSRSPQDDTQPHHPRRHRHHCQSADALFSQPLEAHRIPDGKAEREHSRDHAKPTKTLGQLARDQPRHAARRDPRAEQEKTEHVKEQGRDQSLPFIESDDGRSNCVPGRNVCSRQRHFARRKHQIGEDEGKHAQYARQFCDLGRGRGAVFEQLSQCAGNADQRDQKCETCNPPQRNPHAATAEKGRKMMELLVERLGTFLVELSAAEMDESFPFEPL